MPFYVYIIESEVDGTLYTAQSSDLPNRLKKHNRGLIRSTRAKRPYRLGYFEVYATRSEAMWREWELKKRWNTDRKRRLIASFEQNKLREVLGTDQERGA